MLFRSPITWNVIGSILSKQNSKSSCLTLLDDQGNEISSPSDVSGKFCEHFATVASKLYADIPVTMTDPMTFMPDPVTDSFTPSPTTADEVNNIISSLQNKPSHVNVIPIFIIKKLSTFVSPIICNIFNSSISDGIFPSCIKISRIKPLHKGKRNQKVNNFRPISLVPSISKIIEKLMKKRACQFLDEKSILYNKQFGFREKCGTSNAVLHYVDDCVTALDRRLYTISIFLDFSKAFDTVNTDIMLRKLDR